MAVMCSAVVRRETPATGHVLGGGSPRNTRPDDCPALPMTVLPSAVVRRVPQAQHSTSHALRFRPQVTHESLTR